MRVLLDTHVFLWYITGDAKLPATLRATLQEPANAIFLSTASVWEVVVKHQLGKIDLPSPPARYLPLQRVAHGIASLPIDERAMDYLATLPQLHRDPFDRVLIAQALQHDLMLATVDKAVLAYGVPTVPVLG